MINNSLYRTIRRDFDRRQADEKRNQELRIQEVYRKIPEYEALDQEMVSLCADSARSRVLNPSAASDRSTKELHHQIESLKKKQALLLHENGYPADYLEIHYTCPLCKDTGYYENDLCQCFRKAAARLIYDQTNVAPILEKENFNTFNIQYYSETPDPHFGISPAENMRMILSRCKDYIKNFDTQFMNLFIYGETGVGKSFLTHCIANELLKTSHSVLYLTAFELIEAFEDHTFGNHDE